MPEKHNDFVLNNLAEVFIISSNLSEMVFLPIPKPWRVFVHQDSIFPHSKLYMLLSLYIIILLYFKSYTLLLLLDAESFHLDVIINNSLFFYSFFSLPSNLSGNVSFCLKKVFLKYLLKEIFLYCVIFKRYSSHSFIFLFFYLFIFHLCLLAGG